MNAFPVTLVIATSLFHLYNCEFTGHRNVITIYNSSTNSTNCASPAYDIDSVVLNHILQNSTEVRFCQNEIILTRFWTIKGVAHIKFSGGVVLKCARNSGFLFEDVTDLTILKVQLVNCGVSHPPTVADEMTYTASVFIINSFNFNISEVVILNSTGVGLFIKNVRGEAVISNSHFKNNLNNLQRIGVHLEFKDQIMNDRKATKNATINFLACHFENKIRNSEKCSGCGFSGIRQGGGITMILGTHASHNKINISHCTFRNLSAINIGGMNITIRSNATGNVIFISNTTFENNTCNSGGGGIHIRLLNSHQMQPSDNNITIVNSSFIRNRARYGGGVFLNSSKGINSHYTKNMINFLDCTWIANGARYGSAVDALTPKNSNLLLKTTFINSRFERNFIRKYTRHTTTIFGHGTVALKHLSAKFEGETVFVRNTGSPLYLSSSLVEYGTNSQAEFLQNRGLNGGAITMLGSSAIHARSGSSLNFTENQSYFKGGAIYFESIDGHDYLTERKCFIQYIMSDNKSLVKDKPKYFFQDNIAGSQFNRNDSMGKSIYASTLLPCNRQCGHYKGSTQYIAGKETSFDCVAKFEYMDDREFEVTTSAWTIELINDDILLVIPGKEVPLPIKSRDELNQTILTVYKAILWKNNTTNTKARVASPYRYTHESKVVIKGEPSDAEMNLSLTTEHDREMRVMIRIKILQCPPGYILHRQQCKCSAELDVNQRYQGIFRCNSSSFRAKLQRGYWIGYANESYKSLISSICPYGFCNNSKNTSEYFLPMSFNATELDYLTCGDSRTGILCGKCRGNRSAYYHSHTYRCGHRLCSFGWLFYSISALFPVTLVFLAIITFDIQLTSGSVNGLILYYQLSHSMSITANGFIDFSEVIDSLYRGHIFLANMFNLNFFVAEKLSFCLWKGATTLDVIAFKYATVFYSLSLVILTVFIMRLCGHRCSCTKLRRVRNQRRRQITNSVIHGISGFFVLCYSQCTTVSLMLLRPVTYSDPNNATSDHKYVLYDGSMKYFGTFHLRYALPAFFFILTLVMVPPVLLLTYPLCYRVLHLLRIEETKFSRILCKLVPLEKLKPFFDSFQGSFKDKHRYTSGLYFVYRLVSVCLAVFTTNNSDLFHILLEIQLLVMILVHSYFQPYRKSKHNSQDLFIFVNLAIINALTIFNFERSIHNINQKSVCIASSVQVLLLNLPTLYIALKIGFFVFTALKTRLKENRDSIATDLELFTEREEDVDEDNFVSSNSYTKMSKEASASQQLQILS